MQFIELHQQIYGLSGTPTIASTQVNMDNVLNFYFDATLERTRIFCAHRDAGSFLVKETPEEIMALINNTRPNDQAVKDHISAIDDRFDALARLVFKLSPEVCKNG